MSAEETDDTTATNIARLRAHLEEGTLAVQLVDTYQSTTPDQRRTALKTVVEKRLAEIRAGMVAEKPSDASD